VGTAGLVIVIYFCKGLPGKRITALSPESVGYGELPNSIGVRLICLSNEALQAVVTVQSSMVKISQGVR